MNRLLSRAGAGALTFAFCLITVGRLTAQTTAPASTSPATNAAPGSVVADNKPGTDETIVLSPFIVEASEDADSYSAKNTLAGTRVRTELKDVGSAIQVVTAKFLQDTGAHSSQELLVYTTNTEVGGSSGNFTGAGNGAQIDTRSQRTSPQTNTRVRGLASADNTRDFFLTDIPWDSYNVGRVDLQRGPNSILFGIGSPAGIVNSSLNTASFRDSNTVEFRYDNYGTTRESVDLNKVLLKDQVAIRLSLLDDDTKYKQKPAFNHDKRVFGAITIDPKFLKHDGMDTTLKVNYESGKVDANRPRVIPPVDALTPWFNAANTTLYKKTFNDQHINDTSISLAVDPTRGALSKNLADNVTPNTTYSPYLGAYGGQIFDQPTAMFDNPNSGTLAALASATGGPATGYFMPSGNFTGPVAHPGTFSSGPWLVYKGISNYSDYAVQTQQPNYLLGAYKSKTIADPGIFNYNTTLIDGPNKQELQKFHAFNAALSQTFLDNKLGIEIAYDRQGYKEENDNLIATDYLTVEVANTLPDGRANPNVGRAMTIGAPNSNGGRQTVREAIRATGFGELDFKQIMGDTLISKILGIHRITALESTQQNDTMGSSWYSYTTETASWRPWQDISLDARRIPSVSYLSGNLSTVAAANLAHIGGITAVQAPYTDNIYWFNPANKAGIAQGAETSPADLMGWQSKPFRVLDGYHGYDRLALTNASSVNMSRDKINSQAFVWQGYLWDGDLVPTVGWRKDTDQNFNAGNAPANADNSWNYASKTYRLPYGPDDSTLGSKNRSYNSDHGESLSWSFVLHTPKELKKHLPMNTDISLFYNHSDNFQPAGGRRDVFGDSIPSPTGKTKDYGVTITTLDDKLTFKINWYETALKNASLDGGGTGALQSVYRVSSNEAWGYMFAKWAQLNIVDFQGGVNYARTIPGDATSPLIDPSVPLLQYQPLPGETVAHALAAQNAAINTFIDPANKPPQKFLTFWGINRDTWDPTLGWAGGGVNFNVPSSLAVTGDTLSKGTEYELSAQPVPGWNITVNASKTSAERQNLAGSFAGWVDNRNAFYNNTPAGDVRMWNGSVAGTQTVKQVWNTEFYASYLLYRLQENADVPELRPWHFNLITNYDFHNGSLKGLNVGGGYRWQDGIVTGYPIVNGFFDLKHPYMGPKETTIDMWVGYERKISKNLTWRIQLNARNLLGNNKLIPITVEPDGSPGTSRIAEPKVFTLTNTLKF